MTTFVWFCTSPCWIWRLECQKNMPKLKQNMGADNFPRLFLVSQAYTLYGLYVPWIEIIFPHDLVIKSTFFAGLITVVCWRRDSCWLPLNHNVLLAHFSLPLKNTIFTNETLIQKIIFAGYSLVFMIKQKQLNRSHLTLVAA